MSSARLARPSNERTKAFPSYSVSQRVRKHVGESFGWMTTLGRGGKPRYLSNETNRLWLTLTATASNLVRIAKPVAAPASDVRAVRGTDGPRQPDNPPQSAAQSHKFDHRRANHATVTDEHGATPAETIVVLGYRFPCQLRIRFATQYTRRDSPLPQGKDQSGVH
jgi:hypothetical protein